LTDDRNQSFIPISSILAILSQSVFSNLLTYYSHLAYWDTSYLNNYERTDFLLGICQIMFAGLAARI